MTLLRLSRSALWFLLSACSALALNAAEIELQREVQIAGSLVRLADVATIHSVQPEFAQRLSAAELFPAPAVDGWVKLDRRDLLELLELRGFDPLDFQLTGAAESTIYGRRRIVPNSVPAALPMTPQATPLPQPSTAMRTIARARPYAAKVDSPQPMVTSPRLEQAVVDYLRRTAGSNYPWEVVAEVSSEDASRFSSGGLEISGGQAPYTGVQTFVVRVHRAEGIADHRVRVAVSLPARVLAASRTLSAGDMLTADDLTWIVPTANGSQKQTIQNMDDVLGMQMLRNIAAGQVLDSSMLRRPLLVQRNAVARLQVRAGGVVVGTKVRAMDDGAQGDSIRVQSLFDRQQYTVTVVGPQLVEMVVGQ